MLDDDDPIWEQHTGKERHYGEEWGLGDSAIAERFYALVVREKARFILNLLIDHPGKLIASDEIWSLRTDLFPKGRSSVSGSLSGMSQAWITSGRRYPFYWWAGDPTHYAMKLKVADLFREARNGIGS
jgi:hypothetical protein